MYLRAKYVNEFLRLKCSGDILNVHGRIFPNAKEVTESQAAFFAALDVLQIDSHDENIVIVCPGDGKYSRTSILCAFRTKWECVNIDPMADTSLAEKVNRLTIINDVVENVPLLFDENTTVIIAAVHSHALPRAVLKNIRTKGTRHMIAIPCCVSYDMRELPPTFSYVDPYILSPKNKVMIWKDV